MFTCLVNVVFVVYESWKTCHFQVVGYRSFMNINELNHFAIETVEQLKTRCEASYRASAHSQRLVKICKVYPA